MARVFLLLRMAAAACAVLLSARSCDAANATAASTTTTSNTTAKVTPKPKATPTPTTNSDSFFIDFRSVDGKLLADGKPFYIRGVNWFGFETIESTVQGIWPYGTTIPKALDLLASYDINAIRLPLALDSIENDPEVPKDQTAGMPELAGKSYLDVLDVFVNEARKRNMLILLDNHRMEAAEPDFPDTADVKAIIPALQTLAQRYCNNPATWNVIGVDLKNEPKGEASWGMGKATDWDVAAAEIGNAVLKKCKRWLIFVEGVQTNIQGVTTPNRWGQAGGSLQGAKKFPVQLDDMEKLVYSPHLISPGVDYKSPWWHDDSFPDNLPKIWDQCFGEVPKVTGNAVVVGAWGAKMEGKDQKWVYEVADYLQENEIGSFYWAFNPQSADTGGLVKDDWKTPIDNRFALLSQLPTTKVEDLLSKFAECTDKCRGFGQCVDGQCECYSGWSGPQCDICTPGDTKACNNAGTCQKDMTCACDAGVDGKFCDGASCDGIDCGSSVNAWCHNGQCVCKNRCTGDSCRQCAANSSALMADGSGSNAPTLLCDECPAPVDDSAAAPSAVTSIMRLMVTAVMGLLLQYAVV